MKEFELVQILIYLLVISFEISIIFDLGNKGSFSSLTIIMYMVLSGAIQFFDGFQIQKKEAVKGFRKDVKSYPDNYFRKIKMILWILALVLGIVALSMAEYSPPFLKKETNPLLALETSRLNIT